MRIKASSSASDRGDRIIAQEIVPLELSEENNKPKVFEVMVPNSRFSQGNMARLATVLTANPGGDRVEIFIEQVDGRVLRAECRSKVNARSIPLLAEAKAIVGNQGRVTVIQGDLAGPRARLEEVMAQGDVCAGASQRGGVERHLYEGRSLMLNGAVQSIRGQSGSRFSKT